MTRIDQLPAAAEHTRTADDLKLSKNIRTPCGGAFARVTLKLRRDWETRHQLRCHTPQVACSCCGIRPMVRHDLPGDYRARSVILHPYVQV